MLNRHGTVRDGPIEIGVWGPASRFLSRVGKLTRQPANFCRGREISMSKQIASKTNFQAPLRSLDVTPGTTEDFRPPVTGDAQIFARWRGKFSSERSKLGAFLLERQTWLADELSVWSRAARERCAAVANWGIATFSHICPCSSCWQEWYHDYRLSKRIGALLLVTLGWHVHKM